MVRYAYTIQVYKVLSIIYFPKTDSYDVFQQLHIDSYSQLRNAEIHAHMSWSQASRVGLIRMKLWWGSGLPR